MTISVSGDQVTIVFDKGAGDFNDEMVIYIDSKPNDGYSSTVNFADPDAGDKLRRAITGAGIFAGGTRSVVNFPDGFSADYAIAVNTGFGGLWELVENASFPFIAGVGNPTSNTQASFTMTFNKNQIGLGADDPLAFSFVITYMDAFGGNGVWRSDEGFGDGLPTGNPGTGDVTFSTSKNFTTTTNEISGEAGWRMLSLPVEDVPVSVLAGQNLVQGITGSNAFYNDGGDYESFDSNLYYTLDAGEWQEPADFNYTFLSGQGFIWYMFHNDDNNSVSLPFNLGVTGKGANSNVTIAMNTGWDFTLIGNPFLGDLNTNDVSGWGNLQATAQTWDPSLGGAGGGTNGFVTVTNATPFTGFIVESDGGAGDITIPITAVTFSNEDAEKRSITLNLNGENEHEVIVQDNTTSVVFRDGATHGWDIYDATKLVPLLSSYATLGFVGERAGEERVKVIDSRPFELSEYLELPVALNVFNFGGSFEVSANLDNVPDDWSILLLDNENGESVDLRIESYVFEHNMDAQQVQTIESKMPDNLMMNPQEAIGRFTLLIDPQTTSAPSPELPQELRLSQNYPNPFNPTTQIAFELPETTDVVLEVYNIQGQRVAVLLSGQQQAGKHSVTFDAAHLSSGVYIYRLMAGGQTLTKKMTLVK